MVPAPRRRSEQESAKWAHDTNGPVDDEYDGDMGGAEFHSNAGNVQLLDFNSIAAR